jgi:hypothetical protein
MKTAKKRQDSFYYIINLKIKITDGIIKYNKLVQINNKVYVLYAKLNTK